MNIGIVVGSIREGRRGIGVGQWVLDVTGGRDDAQYELIDLKQFDVPLLTDAVNPSRASRQYSSEQVRRWSAAIDASDGFVFVTPEYNHGVPGGFKNAFDSLAPEWLGKAVGFVSYGSALGIRAVEQWRQIVANFSMTDVRAQVSLSTFTEFAPDGSVTPTDRRVAELETLLDQVTMAVRTVQRT